MAEDGQGFGLYVHWPFCQAKCPYCDFNSHVFEQIDQRRWARALAQEITRVAQLTNERSLGSVFFGGGTPSTMVPETVAEIMAAVRAGWRTEPHLEVTLEANPTSVDAGRFAGYREAGVTRLSLGIQAMNDRDLKRLGRLHDVAEAKNAFEIARKAFDRVSFDLICARQDQTLQAWQTELDEALAMAVDHLSLYQLTIEPGTAFAARLKRGGLTGLPGEDLGADLYEATVERCAAHGLHLYEVSNFAIPGAECRHNLLYWSGADYAGVGPGAHGRLTIDGARLATVQERLPGVWLKHVERREGTHEQLTRVPPYEQYVEYVLMGLRKRNGLDLSFLEALSPDFADFRHKARDMADLGLIEIANGRVWVSANGRLLLDSITSRLLPE